MSVDNRVEAIAGDFISRRSGDEMEETGHTAAVPPLLLRGRGGRNRAEAQRRPRAHVRQGHRRSQGGRGGAHRAEDRRRFRQWQSYLKNHLCQPVWDRFCQAAALIGNPWFPSMALIEKDCRRYCPVDIQPTSWEWVDPATEQSSTQAAITAFQSTYSDELGSLGRNWRHVFYQRAKEERLLKKLGLVSPNAAIAAGAKEENAIATNEEANAAVKQAATGEMASVSTLQFKRNRKAIETILGELTEGKTSENKARVYLASIGLTQTTIDALIADALDGSGKLESISGEV